MNKNIQSSILCTKIYCYVRLCAEEIVGANRDVYIIQRYISTFFLQLKGRGALSISLRPPFFSLFFLFFFFVRQSPQWVIFPTVESVITTPASEYNSTIANTSTSFFGFFFFRLAFSLLFLRLRSICRVKTTARRRFRKSFRLLAS